MTEQKRKLGIRERSCGLQSPPKNPKPNARKHNMSVRSLGHQSPPRGRDCIINPNSYLRSDKVKNRKMNVPKPKVHSGFGILSSSAWGNPPSDWSWSPQSPPHVFEIKSGMEVCTT